MNVEEIILIEAHKLILKDGWGQGCRRDYNTGAYCSLGAIEQAILNLRKSMSLRDRVVSIFNRAIENKYSIIYWNDTDGRTRKEVLAAFRKAIKNANQA